VGGDPHQYVRSALVADMTIPHLIPSAALGAVVALSLLGWFYIGCAIYDYAADCTRARRWRR
jgi:hypothetical protein